MIFQKAFLRLHPVHIHSGYAKHHPDSAGCSHNAPQKSENIRSADPHRSPDCTHSWTAFLHTKSSARIPEATFHPYPERYFESCDRSSFPRAFLPISPMQGFHTGIPSRSPGNRPQISSQYPQRQRAYAQTLYSIHNIRRWKQASLSLKIPV